MLSAAAVLAVAVVVFYLLGSVLFTTLLSALIAYILLPVTHRLVRLMPWRESRPELARGIAVALIFAVAIAITVGLLAVAIPPTIRQTQEFIDDFPTFFEEARTTVEDWVGEYTEEVPVDIRAQIESSLADVGRVVLDGILQILPQTFSVIANSFSLFVGFATMPLLIFYFSKDSKTIGRFLLKPFPSAIRPDLVRMLKIVDGTLGGYLRGQMILGITVGTVVAIGLYALGIPFAIVLGIVAGITELIPIIGPWIGAAVAIFVTLATAPEQVIWVALLFLVVQLLENTLLVPRIQAETLDIHPVAVAVVIILGSHFFGIWGIILGPPIVSLGNSIIRYIAQEWDKPDASDDGDTDSTENSDADAIAEAKE